MSYCKQCGQKIEEQGEKCPNCGYWAETTEQSDNGIASTLKVYGFLNGAAAVVLAIFLGTQLESIVLSILVLGAGIPASFMIYAFGEVLQLLHEIKQKVAQIKSVAVTSNVVSLPVTQQEAELPDI